MRLKSPTLCVLIAAALPCFGEGRGESMRQVKEWYDHGSLGTVQKAAEHDSRGKSAGEGAYQHSHSKESSAPHHCAYP